MGFDEEFSGSGLSSAWAVLNRPGDSSNSEAQCYVPTDASVGGGTLVLTSKLDASCSGYAYTSAMVQWRSYNFTYGSVEFRARLAGGTGPWPAIWLLGADCQQSNIITADNTGTCNWPAPGSDEIDIAEVLGGDHTSVNEQVHSNGANPGCRPGTSDVSRTWHIYRLDWHPGSLVWKIDGVTTCTVTQSVPSHPMFLIINTALGGSGGGPIVNSTLPQTLAVDYVHVLQ